LCSPCTIRREPKNAAFSATCGAIGAKVVFVPNIDPKGLNPLRKASHMCSGIARILYPWCNLKLYETVICTGLWSPCFGNSCRCVLFPWL